MLSIDSLIQQTKRLSLICDIKNKNRAEKTTSVKNLLVVWDDEHIIPLKYRNETYINAKRLFANPKKDMQTVFFILRLYIRNSCLFYPLALISDF